MSVTRKYLLFTGGSTWTDSRHLRTQRLAVTQTALNDAARDRNGVTVSGEGVGR